MLLFYISIDNLHITQNLTVCQLLLCDPPNCQNSLTKLKFLMLYSIVDRLDRIMTLDTL